MSLGDAWALALTLFIGILIGIIMAQKFFATDINLGGNQLRNVALHNVTTAEMLQIATGISSWPNGGKGVKVWNTDEEQEFTWNGSAWKATQLDFGGSVQFKGPVDASVDVSTQVEAVSGYEYVIVGAGVLPPTLALPGGSSLTIHGTTNMDGNIEVNVGDRLLLTGNGADVKGTQSNMATDAYVLGKGAAGGLAAALQSEVTAGVGNTTAVTAETLAGALVANGYVRQFKGVFAVDAGVDLVVTHNLHLIDLNAFTVQATAQGIEVGVEIVPSTVDSLIVRSNFPIPALTVTVQGASTSFAA